ncbi:MAG: tRNA (guanosine(37)-N1)-methyltransferase TrmD [bacterium]
MRYHIISLFPESTTSYLNESILARAVKNKLISFHYYNPRDFVKPTKAQKDKEKPYIQVDDKAYGGGPGMIIKAIPIAKAVEKALKFAMKKKDFTKELIVFLSPSGEQFTNDSATKMAQKFSDIIFICGRYEGIDARVKKIFKMKDYSVGPFVTTGGELPAMIMIDSISRQIEGVLGKFNSREESRDASKDVYTRPEIIEFNGKKYTVPAVLVGGNHKEIEGWRMDRKGGIGSDGVVNTK